MAYWEFLLQKEGDRSWLPLESPEVEILEGRYRVVARSSYIHTPVEVRITHVAAEESSPKRRTQKRMGQTNKEGLLVVIPFTRLQPGFWELRCTNDLMADLIGESWQYEVKLQSLSQDAEISGDWDPDWSSNVASSAPSTPTPVSAALLTPLESQYIPLTPTLDQQVTPTLDQQEAVTEPVQPAEPETAQPEENPAEVETAATAEAEAPSVTEQLPTYDLNEAIAPTTQISTPAAALRSLAEEMSQQVIDSAFDIFERESFTDDTPEYPVVQPVVQRADPIPLPSAPPLTLAGQPVQLCLTSEAYVARSGRAVELTGQIILAPATDASPEAAAAVTLPASELQIRLIDPQTSQILAEVLHPLTSQPLPATFQVGIAVPPSHHTHLVLGEITLLASVAGVISAIAPQSFTITADLNELLEAIANEEEAEVARRDQEKASSSEQAEAPADPELAEHLSSEANEPRNIASLNFRSIPKQSPLFQPSIGMTMPPQIRRDESKRSTASGPQLPVLPTPKPPAPSIPDDTPEEADFDLVDPLDPASADKHDEVSDPTPAEISAIEIEAASDNLIAEADEDDITTENFLGQPPDSDDFLAIAPETPIFGLEGNTDWSYSEAELRSPLEVEFQALNLEDRFLARLSAMATDPDLAASLDPNRGLRPEPVQAQPVPPPDPAPEESPPPPEMEAPETEEPEAADAIPDPWLDGPSEEELTAHEIVVYDLEELEPAAPVTPQSQVPSPAVVPEPISRPAPPRPPSPQNLEDEIPVSMPTIRIPDGDFVAGQTVEMTVQFAPTPLRTYIKFWLSDRQTRTLLDGPHWLVDFTPNGLGQMECQTQFAVPYGCLELQLEATAVEMATQRESPKVTVNREVIPPDAPAFSLDEFDL